MEQLIASEPFGYLRTVFVTLTERRADGAWLGATRLIQYFHLYPRSYGALKPMSLIHHFPSI